jgi:hypothetical protein
MKILYTLFLTAFAAAALIGCSAPVANTNSTQANTSTASAPTVETLKAIESTAFDAYKNRDGKYFEGLLVDKFVASSDGQRLDKRAMIKMIAEHKCEIRSFAFSDEKLTNVGASTALITMKVTADGSCDGRRMPSPFISASLYVLIGTDWNAAWHGEVAVVDPSAPPQSNADDKKLPDPAAAGIIDDGPTAELAAIERSVWEGWMSRDAAKLDSLTARELAFVNIFGGYFKNRVDTLKDWTANPCEIKSVDVADATSVSVTDDTAILMHRGTANGTCFGQKVDPILGTSVYVKEGPKWKLAFTMNMPAA